MTITANRGFGVRNPVTGKVDYEVVPPTREELHDVAVRLRSNQGAWAASPLSHRVEVLSRWAEELERATDVIVAAEAVDRGNFRTAAGSMAFIMANLRGWCTRAEPAIAAMLHEGTSERMPSVQVRTQLVPYPLVGVISPWNGPLTLALVDAIPALFAGCAVLIKPSELAPRFVAPVMDTINKIPELAGVLHFVVGDGRTGEALIEEADAVCFTGSVPTGRKVAEVCGRQLIPLFLELGGKDPAIVTASADIERAATAILRGGAFATGQGCASVERIYVDAVIHDEFVRTLTRMADEVRLTATDPDHGEIGPFGSAEQAKIVDRHLDDALAKGAVMHTGGLSRVIAGGIYMPPVVLTEVTHDMEIMREETFGPVLPVMRFRDEQQAISLANDTSFGLSASVFAGTVEEAARIGEQINAGEVVLQDALLTMVGVWDGGSDSFGCSGLGSPRGGPIAIDRFFRRKILLTNTAAPIPLVSRAR
jgi:succinate-semialdehyde dehydrogenase/glutarate-semialdehyde dehydrogenase